MVLQPLFDNILIEIKEEDGIIVVEKSSSELKRGIVVAVGEGSIRYDLTASMINIKASSDKTPRSLFDIKVGDIVYFNDRDAKVISQDNKKLYILNQSYVYAKEIK